MKSQKKESRKRIPAPNVGGRPARPMSELIPDTPEAIARPAWPGRQKSRRIGGI